MSPYEILAARRHHRSSWNDETGQSWLRRILNAYPKSVWLNPMPEKYWPYTQTIQIIRGLMEGRMYPLTLDGLDAAMRQLMH